MNSRQIFELALGDIHPWQIEEISLTDGSGGERELHIRLDFKAGSTFLDEYGVPCKAYDTANHSWRHLNFFQYKCYLHAPVPRIIDSKDSVKKVVAPWARRNSGFSLLFESHVLALIQLEMTVSSVARLVGEHPQRIWHTFNHYIELAKTDVDDSGIVSVGIDETSRRKGHDYITIGVDLDTHRVFKVVEGKDSAAVQQLADHLGQKGSAPSEVKSVCIDMSKAFIAGVAKSFPQARVSFDRFHIVQEINRAMDTLRKTEQSKARLPKGHKFSFLKNPESLPEKKRQELSQLVNLYPKLGKAYRLKCLFREIRELRDPFEVEAFLTDWCQQVRSSAIPSFLLVVKTIENHWKGVVNAFSANINNGLLEGINSKIQLAKKRARGYRNVQNLINMVHFLCGKLNFNYPLHFT
jgi:transposase